MKRIWSALAVYLVCLGLLCGCSARSSEDLYALPKQSDMYYDLQNAIDEVMAAGVVYAGPLSGANRQSVQLVDLDGDQEDEAVVFVKTSGELPLKVYIFDRTGKEYVNVAVIEGEGSSFDAVEYVQLDSEPGMEILIGRSVSDQVLQSLAGYTWRDGTMAEVMNCTYSEFKIVDLDADDKKDVFVLRLEAEQRAGVAELYCWRTDHMQREQEASMSLGAKQIKRIISGYLEQNVPAVFVASTYEEDAMITDIFAYCGSTMRNIATGGGLGTSAQTVRSYPVYATDIDQDGVIEMPMPLVLPSHTTSEEMQWTIDWYSMDSNGTSKIKMTTYHNYAAGWYLELPDYWHGRITVSKTLGAGANSLTISKWIDYGVKPQDILTVYAFTGENRYDQAQTGGRFLLAEKGETVYAASLGSADWSEELTQEELSAMFHFIYMDWDLGET